MKYAKWGWNWIRGKTESLLYLNLWLMGVSACLGILFLLLFPAEPASPVRIVQTERWIEPLPGFRLDTEGIRILSKTAPDFSKATWTPVSLPDVQLIPAISAIPAHAAMARVWIRVRYDPALNHKTNEPLAIYDPRIMGGADTRIRGGAYAVWVGGKMVHANVDGWRMQWNKPLLVTLPAQDVRPDKPAEILIAVPFYPWQGYAVGSLYVGPASALQRLYDRRFLLVNILPHGGIAVALLLSIFSLPFWLARRSETPHLLLTLASVAWIICNLQYLIDFDNLTASRWFSAVCSAAYAWIVMLSFLSGFRIAGKRFPRLEKALALYTVGVTWVTLPLWHLPISTTVFRHYGNLAVGIGLACLYSWVTRRDGRREVKIVALSLWSIMLLGVHDVLFLSSQCDPDGFFWLPYTTFLLFGSFIYSIQRRYLDALHSVEDLNASLNERLLARERQLEANHRALSEAEKQKAILMEQQRLMREMHDGIGSALISSLLLAEQRRLPPERLAGVLRDCIDELKLVIDSLEPFEQDIATMLASVHQRLGRRIEEAGIRIVWEMDDLPPLQWFDQTHVRHLLRIVQEVLTNILKHAQANEIRVSASRVTSQIGRSLLFVRISDNGVGYTPGDGTGGRGLKNMRQRVQELRGELSIDAREGHGTTIELRLPFELEEIAST